MSRFVGDAQDFRRPDEPPVLVITEDLLDDLGVTGCSRDEQLMVVKGWLADHEPNHEPNRVLAHSLREDGLLAENVSKQLVKRTTADGRG